MSDPNKLDVGGVNADAGKALSKGLFGTDKISAVPANPMAAVADLNADVRDVADSYRDPAIARPQEKIAGAQLCLPYSQLPLPFLFARSRVE